MIQLNPSHFYLMLEAIAVLAVAVIACVGYILWQRRQRQQALLALVARLKENGPQRIAALGAALESAGVADENQRHEQAQQILKAETGLYRFLIQALLKGQGKQLLELDTQVEALMKEISAAVPIADAPSAAASNHETLDLSEVIDAVRSEQTKVLTEIKATREELKKALAGASLAAATGATAAAETPVPQEPVAEDPTPPPQDEPASNTSSSLNIEELDLDFGDEPATADAAAEEEDIVDLGMLEDEATAEQEPEPTHAAAEPESAAGTDTSGIVEMPDDLLFGADEQAKSSEATSVEAEDKPQAAEAMADEDSAAQEAAAALQVEEDSSADLMAAMEAELGEPELPAESTTPTEAAIDLVDSEAPSDNEEIVMASASDDAPTETEAASDAEEAEAPTQTTEMPETEAEPEKPALELALDPDDILDQVAAAATPPVATEKTVKTAPAAPNQASPPPAAEAKPSMQPEPASNPVDIDPDEILDSLLGETGAANTGETEQVNEDLLPNDDADIPSHQTAEKKKNNDIVSENSASADAVSAADSPLIPDDESEAEKPAAPSKASPAAKAQDKEALIAELEDLLG